MSVNRPDSEEGVVLTHIAEVVEAAEERFGPWPELKEPIIDSPLERLNFAERITLWTMAGLLGAITIYAISTGDREVLIAVLTVAAGTLFRLARPTPHTNQQGEKTNDPRIKRSPKKRRHPG